MRRTITVLIALSLLVGGFLVGRVSRVAAHESGVREVTVTEVLESSAANLFSEGTSQRFYVVAGETSLIFFEPVDVGAKLRIRMVDDDPERKWKRHGREFVVVD
jgi:hypothetical protein